MHQVIIDLHGLFFAYELMADGANIHVVGGIGLANLVIRPIPAIRRHVHLLKNIPLAGSFKNLFAV